MSGPNVVIGSQRRPAIKEISVHGPEMGVTATIRRLDLGKSPFTGW